MPTIALILGLSFFTTLATAAETIHLARTEHEILIDRAFPIVREAYRRIGIEAVELNVPGERSIKIVDIGQAFGDVMHFENVDKSYPNLVRVPVPVIYFDATAFTKNKYMQLNGWKSLQPYQLCIRRGIKAIEFYTESMNRTIVTSYAQAFQMLVKNRCDVAILPKHVWLEEPQMDLKGITSLPTPIQRFPLYHHVYKGNKKIIPELTRALQEMEKEGVMSKVQKSVDSEIEEMRQRREIPEKNNQ